MRSEIPPFELAQVPAKIRSVVLILALAGLAT
jgi:hypothetical protein